MSQIVTSPVDAELTFREAKLLLLTDVKWDCDMGLIQSALVKRKREFKAPFSEQEPHKTVRKELKRMTDQAERLFRSLYPTFKSTERRTSFRPMITGPEPMHFDTYGGPNPLVTAYINVAKDARKYALGPSFPELTRHWPELMRLVAHDSDQEITYAIRQRTMDGRPPLGKDTKREYVDFPTGAIWFFNAKTVSHEVIFGRGALGVSWEVPGCGAKMPDDLMKEIL